jgi:hypothetical protein
VGIMVALKIRVGSSKIVEEELIAVYVEQKL